MARAKSKGIRIGRPRLDIELRQKIARRAAKGESAHAIAKALGLDRHTVVKYATLQRRDDGPQSLIEAFDQR